MDNAAKIAWSDAPLDERRDAQTELHKAHAPRTLSDLVLPPEDIKPVIDFIRQDLEDQAMAKAMQKNNVVPFPSVAARTKAPGMQSVHLDDIQVTVQGDYYEKPGIFSFDSMRAMVHGTPILNAVIMTRIRQVQRFCRVQESGRGPGFRIALKDKEAQPGEEEKQSIMLLQDFFTNCGWEKNARQRMRLKRDNFPTFMAKLVRETLTMDSMPIETEFKRDKSLGLDGLYAVDGSTIRLCTEQGYQGDDEIFALQVVQGQIRSAYGYDDLIYVPRNPVADVLAGGYGLAETELLIRVVTGFLNAFTYNTKFFDSNQIPKGILNLYGNYNTADLDAFKRYWNAMVKGINNAWTLPVLVSKDQESKAQFESFGDMANEIMFAKWMTFLTSIICAIYSIAPDEINFESFTSGTSALSGSDTDEKLENSKDKGLRPLLSYFENTFTDYVVSEYGDKYVFRWAGLDEEKPETIQERQKLGMTWNEFRALDDLPKVEGKLGDAPMNPALIGPWQAENQQPAEDFGQPGAQGQPGAAGDDDQDGQDFGDASAEGDDGSDFGAQDDQGAMQKAFGMPPLRIE